MYLLDSSVAIELLTEGKRSETAISFINDEEVAIASPTVHEVLAGVKNEDENRNKLNAVIVLDYDKESAEISARLERDLKKTGQLLGIFDMLIASVAIRHKLPLVTFDKAFSRVKGLDAKILV